jgi:nitrous oxide reductase accessory protein NosL
MRRLSLVLLVALAVAGCKKKESAPPQPAQAGAPEVAGASIKGKVLERLDAPPYSYLKLQTAQGEAWAAVPKTEVAKDAEVTVAGAMPMQGFESKTLNRKFETVYFGTLAGEGAPAGAPAPGPMPDAAQGPGIAAQHAAAAAGPADVGDVKVPKASGTDARTVAEIYAQRAALKEKAVTVRGKVVKFNEGIMNRNWVHLRDGTGTAGKDNDITVTTGDRAVVGDVVVVKGTVRVDKDFGAGYAYPVIVEDAKLSK